MQEYSDLTAVAGLVLILLIVIVVGHFVRGLVRKARGRPSAKSQTENAILVDGSNVMYWGGEPSAKVLKRVIDDLKAKGFAPIVVFDASVGYRLSDRYLDDATMATLVGLKTSQVLVVSKGQVADEILLKMAQDNCLRIVTNDRYRDWGVQFPLVKRKGRLIKGEWREGSVVLRGL